MTHINRMFIREIWQLIATMVEKNKKIRLDAAKKTIASLENEQNH